MSRTYYVVMFRNEIGAVFADLQDFSTVEAAEALAAAMRAQGRTVVWVEVRS